MIWSSASATRQETPPNTRRRLGVISKRQPRLNSISEAIQPSERVSKTACKVVRRFERNAACGVRESRDALRLNDRCAVPLYEASRGSGIGPTTRRCFDRFGRGCKNRSSVRSGIALHRPHHQDGR